MLRVHGSDTDPTKSPFALAPRTLPSRLSSGWMFHPNPVSVQRTGTYLFVAGEEEPPTIVPSPLTARAPEDPPTSEGSVTLQPSRFWICQTEAPPAPEPTTVCPSLLIA